MKNPVIDAILNRRSVREFTEEDVCEEDVFAILEAGRWAPSGQNNQPWKFIIIKNKDSLRKLAKLTIYGDILEKAPVAIAVFLDHMVMYDKTKDTLAVGACIQNMLLAAHSIGLGAVWLGEILKNKEKVNEVLKAPNSLELMAIIALGHPVEKKRTSTRKDLSKIVYKEKFLETITKL
jgi:nitroreductase